MAEADAVANLISGIYDYDLFLPDALCRDSWHAAPILQLSVSLGFKD